MIRTRGVNPVVEPDVYLLSSVCRFTSLCDMEKYKDWLKRNINRLKHYDVFKQHYRRMISILPIEDLIPELNKENLLPGNLKDEVESKVTTKKKVKCFLDSLEGGLKIEKPVKFERFLCVLIDYAEREKDMDIDCLLQDIYKENKTTCLG